MAPEDAIMHRREPSGRTANACKRRALEFTRRAEDATDNEVRDYFYRLRDVWVKAANDQGLLDDRQAPPADAAGPSAPPLS
jgi:hypothetical protein